MRERLQHRPKFYKGDNSRNGCSVTYGEGSTKDSESNLPGCHQDSGNRKEKSWSDVCRGNCSNDRNDRGDHNDWNDGYGDNRCDRRQGHMNTMQETVASDNLPTIQQDYDSVKKARLINIFIKSLKYAFP